MRLAKLTETGGRQVSGQGRRVGCREQVSVDEPDGKITCFANETSYFFGNPLVVVIRSSDDQLTRKVVLGRESGVFTFGLRNVRLNRPEKRQWTAILVLESVNAAQHKSFSARALRSRRRSSGWMETVCAANWICRASPRSRPSSRTSWPLRHRRLFREILIKYQ